MSEPVKITLPLPTAKRPFAIHFVYDEPSAKWEVYAHQAASELEALQGFNAVLLTMRDAIPEVDCNKAELIDDQARFYKISVGQLPMTAVGLNRYLAQRRSS